MTDDRTDQEISLRGAEFVLAREPAEHVRVRHAQPEIHAAVKLRLTADRDQVFVIYQPRVVQVAALVYSHGELHIERCLYSIAQALAIALNRVAVSDVEVCS